MNKKYGIEKCLHVAIRDNEELQKIDKMWERGLLTYWEALQEMVKIITKEED